MKPLCFKICLNLVAFFFSTRLLLREREGVKMLQCDRFAIWNPGRHIQRLFPGCPGLDLQSWSIKPLHEIKLNLPLSYSFYNTNFCFIIHHSGKCWMEPRFTPKSVLIPKLVDLPTLLNWLLKDQFSSEHLDPMMTLGTDSHPAEPITPTQPPLGETSPTCLGR